MKRQTVTWMAVFFGVFLLFGALPIAAQTSHIGIKGAVFGSFYGGEDWNDTVTDLDDQTGASADNAFNAGFSISGFIEIGISRTFSIQPEIGYTRRSGGVLIEQNNNDNEQKSLHLYDLLEIPVFLKPHGRVGDHVTLYGLLGPRVSFVLGDVTARSKEETDDTTTTTTSDYTPDTSILLGGSVGAGLAGDVNGARVFFEVLYSRAFNSAFDKTPVLETGETTKSPILNGIGLWL